MYLLWWGLIVLWNWIRPIYQKYGSRPSYQKYSSRAGRLSHWLRPVTCPPLRGQVCEDVSRGEAPTSISKICLWKRQAFLHTHVHPQEWACLHQQTEEEEWKSEWCWTLQACSPNPREIQGKVRGWKQGFLVKCLLVLHRPLHLKGCSWRGRKWESACVRKHICKVCFLLSLTVLWFLKGFIFSVPSRSAARRTGRKANCSGLGTKAVGLHGFPHPKFSAGPGIHTRVRTQTCKCPGTVCRSTFKNVRH